MTLAARPKYFANFEKVIIPESPAENSLLSQEEWEFVRKTSALFPDRKIYERFVFFESLDERQRQKYAYVALHTEKRQGLVQRIEDGLIPQSRLPQVESIFEHSQNMKYMVLRIFNNEAIRKQFGITQENYNDKIRTAFRLATRHDMPEALTSDFTPEDMKKISPEIKERLEDLASRILFASRPKDAVMLGRYERKETKLDHLNKVIDVIEGLVDLQAMDVEDNVFDEWAASAEKTINKYPEAALAFGRSALNDIKRIRNEFGSDLVQSYQDVNQRRRAIIEMLIPVSDETKFKRTHRPIKAQELRHVA